MISRYEKKEISEIWNQHNKHALYLESELALLSALEDTGRIPKGISDTILKNSSINVDRIEEIERETKHDVIAFCTSITENLSPEVSKYFHFGVTSSDIIDTALTLQIKKSLEIIIPSYKELLSTLKDKALEHKESICLGRSHGMYAEPTSFGVKLLGHFKEFERHFNDLQNFYDNDLTCQFSGAVGNYTILDTEIEKLAAEKLGLKVEPVSTQVIPRDRIAKLVSINALVASAIERLSVEIRHLHRSDVGEVSEGFSKGQKGSSTMPHKKNPISGENLTGMARILRSHHVIAHENIVLWHERDISHSSAERLYLPDNFGLMLYSLDRLNSTIKNLVVHTDEMERKVRENATYLSSYYLHVLIEKTDLAREDIYPIVQQAAFSENFIDGLKAGLKERSIDVQLPEMDFAKLKELFLKNTNQNFSK